MPVKRTVVAVIDDNIGILGAMGRLLSAYGYNTELYASPKEFLEAVMSTEAICLIVDVQLGDSCGIDFARHLASIGLTFPIIFMTANDTECLQKQALETGCIAFLHKPFSADALLKSLIKLPRSAVQHLRKCA
jgi:FixJ family two-component response regulator